MNGVEDSVQVIAVGLNRTGTVSLQQALEILLHGKCYHFIDALESPHNIAFWLKACEDKASDDDFREHFAGYKAVLDTPIPPFYKRLMDIYPKAKVILTVRDPEKWYRSVMSTTYDSYMIDQGFIPRFLEYHSNYRGFTHMLNTLWMRTFGVEYFSGNQRKMIKCYEDYVNDVKQYVPPGRLLVMNITDGWSDMCSFLNLPVPECPFPKANSTLDYRYKIKMAYLCYSVSLSLGFFTLSGIGYQLFRCVKNEMSKIDFASLFSKLLR